MTRIPDGYVRMECEGWIVWAEPAWVSRAQAILAEGCRPSGWLYRSKHGRTRRLELAGLTPAYLKTYHRYRWAGVLKDIVRRSKAVRALLMSNALAHAGFATAQVVAAGERRRLGVLRGAFVVTAEVKAPEVLKVLADLATARRLAAKRRLLGELGNRVGQLHDAGFCHGDLVPANIRIGEPAENPQVIFLDHDRTRQGTGPVSLRHGRRNLVQLNRFVVPGLTAADRWRVFRAYCATRHLDARDTRKRLARWIIAKTTDRRRRVDGVAKAHELGFRNLMREPHGASPRR